MSTFNASIAVLLPLLYGAGQSPPEYSGVSKVGASFVCTLMLALEHVNTRNSCALKSVEPRTEKHLEGKSPTPPPRNTRRSVVPQLASLSMNFSMDSEIFDTGKGNSAVAVDSLMDYFFSLRDQKPSGLVSAVLGPTFSSVAKPTALMASAEQVPMLSYYASSPELSNNEFFTRTYPSDGTAARLLTRVMYDGSVFEGWNHVAVMYRNDAFGRGYVNQMELELEMWANESSNSLQDLPVAFTEEDARAYRTLRSFPFTAESGDEARKSVKRALELVKSSGYSVIVLVGVVNQFDILLEASLAVFV